FQFDFPSNRGQRGINIRHPGNDMVFATDNRTTLRIANHVFETGDGQTLAHAGALVDTLIGPCLERDRFHYLFNEVWYENITWRISPNPRFLLRYGDAIFKGCGVMRFDLRAYPVFERRYDLSTGGIVFWICRKYDDNIQRQPHRVSLNLDVTFLHDIEQPDLNFAGQIRQFVD